MSTTTIYLAGRYGRFRELQAYRDDLRALGYLVQCRWVDGEHEMIDGSSTLEQSRSFAHDDLEDISIADIVINFTDGPDAAGRARGGRHVEFGFALARYLRCMIVGPRENVFHYLDRVEQFDSWSECLAAL